MAAHRAGLALGALAWTAIVCLAQVPDLSGTWRLNVRKSSWGGLSRPAAVVLTIEHREPALKFTGVVDYPNEDARHFGFAGAIDGNAYPGQRSCGPGSISIRRVSASVLVSEFRSPDGQCSETAEISISRDGNVLTQRLRSTAGGTTKTWTEVYERRQAPTSSPR